MGTQGNGHLASLSGAEGGVVEMPDFGMSLRKEKHGEFLPDFEEIYKARWSPQPH